MVRETQLSEDEVFAAIERLLETGTYPTSVHLREMLGGRGSPVTLQRFLGSWYEKNGPEFAKKATARRHLEGDASVHAQLKTATDRALAAYDDSQAERVAGYEKREATVSAREASVAAWASRLDAREVAHTEHINDLRAAASDAAAARDSALEGQATAGAEIAALTARLSLADAAGEALRVDLKEALAAASAIPALQATIAHLKEGVEREQKRVLELSGERDRSRRESDAAGVDLRAARSKIEELQGQLSETRVGLASARSDLAAAVAQLSNARDAVAIAEAAGRDQLEAFRIATVAASEREVMLRADLKAREHGAVEVAERLQGHVASVARLESERDHLLERVGELTERLAAADKASPSS